MEPSLDSKTQNFPSHLDLLGFRIWVDSSPFGYGKSLALRLVWDWAGFVWRASSLGTVEVGAGEGALRGVWHLDHGPVGPRLGKVGFKVSYKCRDRGESGGGGWCGVLLGYGYIFAVLRAWISWPLL